MTELTRQDQEAVASLLQHPGYLLLLELLAASERAALDELEDEREPSALLRGTRFWQFLRKVRTWLGTTPGSIDAELRRLAADGLLDPDAPVSRNDAWARRFAREDEGYDPANI